MDGNKNKAANTEKDGRRAPEIVMVLKYLFSLLLICVSVKTGKSALYVVFGVLELLLVFLLSNALVIRNRTAGNILNGFLLLLLNIQFGVLLFAGSFVQPVMLSNLASLHMLRGKAAVYIAMALAAVGFSLLPVRPVVLPRNAGRAFLPTVLALELLFTMVAGNGFSAFYGIGEILAEEIGAGRTVRHVRQLGTDEEMFYQDRVLQYREKPDTIGERPNIVLIFAEGLSQEILSDERNIMPNLRALQEESLSFENYYNHTFATYRGIIGSLYSGYQFLNLDSNRLVSLQSVLKERGYHTSFINTEPDNAAFTGYLERLGFDEVIDHVGREGNHLAKTDKEALELLSSVLREESKNGQAFFTCIYTAGTHVSYDSADMLFGDGSDRLLNRFYNLDVQFGAFLSRFRESGLAENTILIFTTDHCTYADSDYMEAFGMHEGRRDLVGEIPLILFCSGIRGEVIDAMGRNSLDLVPTICDLLDIDCENYFLGASMFCNAGEANNAYETVFFVDRESSLLTTLNDSIHKPGQQQTDVLYGNIMQYCSFARAAGEE